MARVSLVVDGVPVEVDSPERTLLEVLRDDLGKRSAKDGCAPQGQCGCCTVLVDGEPRVACVTPATRVAGRAVTTVDGLSTGAAWAEAFTATGASQCGFCTPGIVCRFESLRAKGVPAGSPAVATALRSHLCRCTGWLTMLDAYALVAGRSTGRPVVVGRDRAAAEERARLEGGAHQSVAPAVALGDGGFAADTAPEGALVAVLDDAGSWVVAESLSAALAAAGRVQGRRTTLPIRHPLDPPAGEWVRTLRTAWVEPAYLDVDASWCEPGGPPSSPLGNGGAFGGKVSSPVADAAKHLAAAHGRPVLCLFRREDAVRRGPKRPPIAAGIAAGGHVALRAATTAGLRAVADALGDVTLEEVDVAGPPTSMALRAGGWAEVAVLRSSLLSGPDRVVAPNGAVAEAEVDDAEVRVRVACGDVLDEVVLRSYVLGAVHQALGWVRSEGIAVDEAGVVHDLTIRSFGILRATDLPAVHIELDEKGGPPVNGSDAAFAAVAAAAWRHAGHPPAWPVERR